MLPVRTIQSTGATAILSRPVDDLMAQPGLTSVSVQESFGTPPTVNGLTQSTSLTGGLNSPPTPIGANQPGLNSGETENSMSKHWMWIAVVVLVLLGLWYFYGSGTTA